MYDFDLGVLNSERSYVANTLAIVDDGDDSTGRKSSDFKQYEKAIAVTDTYHETRTRFAWVGEIKDKRLQEGLEKLSDEELRLITLYFRDEYSTVELSKVYGIAQQNISKRILKITKFLKKFGFLGVDGGSHLESNWKFQRGDIYFVKLEAGVGSEQNGARPAVILQNDVGNIYSPTLIVAALTSKTDKKVTQATHCQVEEDGLKPSIVQAEQIFTIDKSRVLKFVGHLSPENMRRVDDAVKISLALNPMGSIQKLKPIIRSQAAYAPPEVVDGKPPIYPYTPIKSSFEDAGSVEEMMVYTELQSAVHAMIQRLEYSFTFNPTLLTIPKRKQQVAEILEEAEKYIWRIKEEMRCA